MQESFCHAVQGIRAAGQGGASEQPTVLLVFPDAVGDGIGTQKFSIIETPKRVAVPPVARNVAVFS